METSSDLASVCSCQCEWGGSIRLTCPLAPPPRCGVPGSTVDLFSGPAAHDVVVISRQCGSFCSCHTCTTAFPGLLLCQITPPPRRHGSSTSSDSLFILLAPTATAIRSFFVFLSLSNLHINATHLCSARSMLGCCCRDVRGSLTRVSLFVQTCAGVSCQVISYRRSCGC